jgi:hypothetical protein
LELAVHLKFSFKAGCRASFCGADNRDNVIFSLLAYCVVKEDSTMEDQATTPAFLLPLEVRQNCSHLFVTVARTGP